MKKLLLLVVLLITSLSFGQNSQIKIKSKIPLTYESRAQLKDTIYLTISQWTYNPAMETYKALVVDEVKTDSTSYKVINVKEKSFLKAEVDGLFTALSNPITIGESYSGEMDVLLQLSLLIDTQTNLYDGGITVYGGLPVDWEIIPME